MATLAQQDFRKYLEGVIAIGPIIPTLVAADDVGGDDFDLSDQHTYLAVQNPTGGDIDIDFTITGPCDYGVSHALTVTVDAGQPPAFVGPFNRSRFAEGQGVDMQYSAAGLLVGVARL